MPLISTSRLLPVLASVVLLLPSLAMAASPTEPPPTFPTETEAQQHCSGGLVVWLDVPSRIYYYRGQQLYGATDGGAYLYRDEAKRAGMRPTRSSQ
jgi:hypothetical protein